MKTCHVLLSYVYFTAANTPICEYLMKNNVIEHGMIMHII